MKKIVLIPKQSDFSLAAVPSEEFTLSEPRTQPVDPAKSRGKNMIKSAVSMSVY